MKTSLTKLKSSLSLAVLFLPALVCAKPVAQITELKGSVFVMGADGKTKSLKVNDHVEEKSDVMVEDGASVTFNDYYDATYHMVGGSHMKIFNQSVQLKKGKAWIQSQSSRHPLALTTANTNVDFWKSEYIATFDQATSRTQILVVNGDVEVSNILDAQMKYTVTAGTFSLIDPAVENGVPRTPTKVGLASLNKALSEFKALPTKLKETPAREIASVETETTEPAAPKKGEITFISTNRLPASVVGGAHSYWKKSATKKAAPKVSPVAIVPIKFYGTTHKPLAAVEVKKAVSPRQPASVPMSVKTPSQSQILKTLSQQEFDQTMKEQQAQQPQHPSEVNSLIHDLKSF